jgi:hypothetical protein
MSGMHVLTACLCYILGFRLRGHLARPKEKIEKAVVLVWLFVCLFVYLFVCLFVLFYIIIYITKQIKPTNQTTNQTTNQPKNVCTCYLSSDMH